MEYWHLLEARPLLLVSNPTKSSLSFIFGPLWNINISPCGATEKYSAAMYYLLMHIIWLEIALFTCFVCSLNVDICLGAISVSAILLYLPSADQDPNHVWTGRG